MRYNLDNLGHRLRKARKSRGYTICRLATTAGINESSIDAWENGRHLPRLLELVLVCEVLDISVDSLIDKKPTLSYEIPH